MLLRSRSTARVRALAAIGVCAMLLTSTSAWAKDMEKGFGLDRIFGISGAFGFGERFGVSGNAFSVRAEGAGYWMRTPLRNRGGIEGGAELGYDGFPDNDPSALMTGFLWDFWLGFPITMFELGEDTKKFSAVISPGLGLSWQHAYVYLKAKVAARVAENIVAELNYQWTPYEGSAPFLTGSSWNSGIAMATLRAAVHFNVNDDITLFTYFDWKQSNFENPQTSSNSVHSAFYAEPYGSSRFAPLVRLREDNNFRLGFGVAF